MPFKALSHAARLKAAKRRASDKAYDLNVRSGPGVRIRQGRRWKRFRLWFISRHPLCADPFAHHKADGITVPVDQVHHKEEVNKKPELAFVESNCMSVCTTCHARLSANERKKND